MRLIIEYGKRFEMNRIKSTLSRLNWYKSHGYSPILPENIETEEQILDSIERVFDKKEYEEKKRKLLRDYKVVNKRFEERLKSFFSKIPEDIKILLTKYGVGGSYSLPNTVIINIQSKKPLIKILKHEILHLLSEEEIIGKRLSQGEKEEFIENLEKRFE